MKTVFGRILALLAKRSAARKYARYLAATLQRGYGPGHYYTAPQIEAAARRAGLPKDHIQIGYAAFMPQDAFLNVSPKGDYQALRSLYFRLARAGHDFPVEPAERNAYAWGAGLSASTSHHSSHPTQHE
jgi:hypothetical protein